jgi:predicted DNA-binding transcriptional regulator AlpA
MPMLPSGSGLIADNTPSESKSIADWPCLQVDDFIALVANALVPLRTRASGIECVVAVVIPMPRQGNEKTVWMPLKIDDDLRTKLATLLSDLPPIRFPMPPEEEQEFIERYMLLSYRPRWIPLLLQQADLEGDAEIRFAKAESLRKELVSDPDFKLFDRQHNPVQSAGREAYLDTSLAERILRKRGLLQKVNDVLAAAGGQIAPLRAALARTRSETPVRYPGFPDELLHSGTASALTLETWKRKHSIKAKADTNFESEVEKARPQRVSESSSSNPRFALATEADRSIPHSSTPIAPSGVFDTSESEADHSPAALKRKDASKEQRHSDVLETTDGVPPTASPLQTAGATFPELLSADQVGKLIGCSKQTVFNRLDLTKTGSYDPRFPKPREIVGGQRWVKSEIVAYIVSCPPKN